MKMNIRVCQNKVELSGYVNAVERVSKQLYEKGEAFYEKIEAGAFKEAISRNNNIKLLLNHDYTRELANTANQTLDVYEDSIGLYAKATVTDPDFLNLAKNNKLSGWSFGFTPLKERNESDYRELPLKTVEHMNLYEVSILDIDHVPAYNSMTLNIRDKGINNRQVRYLESFVDYKTTDYNKDNENLINTINNFLTERNK